MFKFFKFLFYSIISLLLIFSLLILTLSQFGLETKRFNNLIVNHVKNYNQNLNLEIKKVKVFLSLDDLTSPKIRISTKNPILISDKKKIKLKNVDAKIDIRSYFKDNFIIEEFEFKTKNNKIRDLISIAALEQPSFIIYNMFLKDGYVSINSSLKFDENGKISDYKFEGQIKDAKIKYSEKYNFGNVNFDFTYKQNEISIKKTNFSYKKIKFLSDEIIITQGSDGKKNITGNIVTKKNTINSKLIKDIFEKDLNFINDQDITFKTKNKFSFTVHKKKIKALEYSSKIDLNNIILNPETNSLKNYLSNYNNTVSLKNNLIELKYVNKNLYIEGKSEYSFDTSFDEIVYKINKQNNSYDFITILGFNNNPIKIKSINYSKKINKKSILKIDGRYHKNKFKLKEITYTEDQNFLKINDLNLNSNFKIADLKRITVDYLNDNNKKNEFTIKKILLGAQSNNHYRLSGSSFDSYNLINDILLSDSDKSFFDNFNSKDEILLSINLNKVFLYEESAAKNLLGKLKIRNNKVHNLTLKAEFEKNGKFKLDVKTLKNKKKITSFYSDNAEPFVKHYNFIKGFKGGKIDFYSVSENNLSNSTLNIFNFKVKEMPALTKLLSLASLQGIADLMTGEGIRFDEFEMNFNNKNKLMTIDEIYALGPALSILMSGYIESDKLISLRGTMVPATTINRIIGKIKILGDILVGNQKGEGVFGVSFKIKGPPKKLKTTVNPIKTLTPRFITRTLEKAKKQK